MHACCGGQSWQTMLSIGIFFAWGGHIFPCEKGIAINILNKGHIGKFMH